MIPTHAVEGRYKRGPWKEYTYADKEKRAEFAKVNYEHNYLPEDGWEWRVVEKNYATV